MTDEFSRRVHDVVLTHLPDAGTDTLPRDVGLTELGLGSLAAVNLVLDLEETFGIEFTDEMLTDATFHTLSSLEAAMRPLVPSATGAGA